MSDYGYSKEDIEKMNPEWSDLFGFSMTDYILRNNTTDLSQTAFRSFYDYKDAYNKCAVFIKDLVDNGTLEEGDLIMFWNDNIIIHNRNGNKYSVSTKKDISSEVPGDIITAFNLLYDYLPSVNRVDVYGSDIRFCQSEAYDIYDELVYTFEGNNPDMSKDAAKMFTYYDYLKPLSISKNRYLISPKNE